MNLLVRPARILFVRALRANRAFKVATLPALDRRSDPGIPLDCGVSWSTLSSDLGRATFVRSRAAQGILDKTALHGVHHGFQTVMSTEFLVDTVVMITQRGQSDNKFPGDLGRVFGLDK